MFALLHSAPTRAMMIGVAAGMRSQIPNAVLAWHRDDVPFSARWRRWPLFRNRWGRRLLLASGTGELIGDKVPGIPPRTEPGPLLGRLFFGGIAGAAVGSERGGKEPIVRGALLGMGGAAIGAVGGTKTRAAVVEMTGLPDPAVAIVEDAAAVSLANLAVTQQ